VRAIQGACRDLGEAVPDDARAAYVIGLGLRDALAHAVPGLPDARYPQLVERYRRHYAQHQNDLSLFPGVLEVLQRLRQRNHWLAVATGKSRQGLDEALAAVELRGVFDATRTADETRSKPHPQMLHELMAEFGVAPERTLMIGDTTHDLDLAQNAGAAGLAVTYGAHPPEGLARRAPLASVDSVAELREWLARNA